MKHLFTFLFVAFALNSMAQDNGLKMVLSGTGYGSYALGYERAITPKTSLNLNIGYWNMDAGLFSTDDFFENQVDFFDTGNGLTFVGFKQGFNTTLEYRYYPKGAMGGVYLSPYARYWQHGFDLEDEIEGNTFTIESRLSGLGLGFQVGYQWIISDAFIIDWYFIGVGVERYMLNGKYVIDRENFNYSTIEPSVRDAFKSDYDFISDKVETEVNDDNLRVKLPVIGPGFKTGLSIGYRF